MKDKNYQKTNALTHLPVGEFFYLYRWVFLVGLWLVPELMVGQLIQYEFDRDYGGNGFEECRVALQTRDSGYVLFGRTTSDMGFDISQDSRDNQDFVFDPNGIHTGDYWLLRLNKNGTKLWEKRYGGDKRDVGKAVIETADGGFILAGTSNSTISGDKMLPLKGTETNYWVNWDYWVIKVDPVGNIVWEKTFGGDGVEDLAQMLQTSDGGLLLTGISNSNSSVDKSETSRGNFDWWVVKTDGLGNIQWEKTIGGDNADIMHDAIETPTGNFILAGQVFSGNTGEFNSPNLGSSDGLLMEIDPLGNIAYQRRFGGNGEDAINRISSTSDGGYVLGCQSASDPNAQKSEANRGDRDLWIVKVNADASIIEWERTFGSNALENLHSIKQNSVDHILVGGFTSSGQGGDVSETSRGGQDFWLFYLDPDGNKKWDKRFGGSGDDVLFNIFQANDGGYMITGHSSSALTGDKNTTNNGNNDFWILKTQCLLDIDFGGDNTVCLGDSVTLNAYDPNCDGCIFDWWDGRDSDSIRVVKPSGDGSFAVTLTDCVGCQTEEQINVSVLLPPSIDLGSNVEICPGSSHSFTPGDNDDWDYLWSTGESTSSITVSTAGTFFVTVTDPNGCEIVDDVSTTLHDLSYTTSVVNTTCHESNGTASVNPTGGTGSYNVTWNNGMTGSVINNVPSGKYIATVDDGFCQIQVDVIVGFEEEPEVEWAKTFGGSLNDKGREILSTDDGGFIAIGETRSTDGDITLSKGGIDFWVIKMNADGDIEWEKNYGGTRNENGKTIIATNDGGYLLGGSSSSNDGDVGGNNGELDYWVVKIDATGNIQWEANFGGTQSEDLRNLIQTFDGGYLLSGITSSSDGDVGNNYGNTDVWLVKINADGDLEWERNYGNIENDGGFIKVLQGPDGNFLISATNSSVGGDVSMNNGSIDFWVIQTDGAGYIQWEKSFGGTGIDLAYDIDFSNDGGYVIAGSSNTANGNVSANYGSNDFWIIKLDADGNIQWNRNYGGSGNDVAWSIKSLDDGGYIIAGNTSSTDGDISLARGSFDYWIIKVDELGNILWRQSYGGSVQDQVSYITQSNDGGFIISGETRSTDGDIIGNKGQADYWIIKLSVPPLPELELGDDQITCPGDEVSFNISDPTCINCTYLWNDGNEDAIRSVFPRDDIKYVVTITNENGCTISDSLFIDPIPVPDLDLGVDTSICSGDEIRLVAGDGSHDYKWSNGSEDAFIDVDSDGIYEVTVTNAASCTIADTIIVSQFSLPPVNLGNAFTICEGDEFTLSAYDPSCLGCSFLWSDDPSVRDSARNFIATSDMLISVEVEDENGCINNADVSITVIPLPNVNLNISSIDPGPHCPDSAFDIELNNSENDIDYQLTDGINDIGSSQTGDGNTLLFNTGSLAVTDTFYLTATNPTGCRDTFLTEVIINIGDDELPVLTCPGDQMFSITTQDCSMEVDNINASATDNCEIISLTYRLDGATISTSVQTGIQDASGESFNVGITQVTYIATDDSGNQDSCSFQIEVLDRAPPVITMEADPETVECDGMGNLTDLQNWIDSNGRAIANEACTNVTWSINPVNPVVSDGCGETGSVQVEFIVSDEAGNTASTIAIFNIEDTQAPQFTVPAGVTISTKDNPSNLSLVGDVVDESDACDNRISNGGMVEATYIDEIESNDCQEIITRTWMLSDQCGNETRQIQNIVLEHEQATVTLTGGGVLCAGDSTDLVFNFSTDANFDVVYTNGQSNFELFDVSQNHTERIGPLSSGTYEIVSVTDKSRPSCPVNFSGIALITVNNLVQIDNGSILFTCDELNNSYQVSFQFVGGVPSGLNITDENGDPIGTLTNGVFTSILLNSGDTYNITIDDGSPCDPIVIEGSYTCPCNSSVGSLVTDAITVCGDEFPSLQYNNDEVLDDNDVLRFYLHDGSASPVGNIISENNTPDFSFSNQMNFGTTYFVTAVVGTESSNGEINFSDACLSSSASVPITFHQIPQAVIDQTNLILSCATDELGLNGSTLVPLSDLSYDWSTPDGRIKSGLTSASPIVDQPGTYVLKVTDNISGCTNTTEVEVKPDEDLPIVKIDPAEILTCDEEVILLSAADDSSQGNDFEYQWTVVSDGNILSGANALEIEVDEPGTYQLEIRDISKNCTSAATIIVEQNIQPPTAEAGNPAQFDCTITSVKLDGGGSSTGENFGYQWLTDDGAIMEGENSLSPSITTAGTYQLIVTDFRNGCTAMDEVVIPINEDFPSDAELNIQAPRCYGDENGSILFEEVIGGVGPYQFSLDGENYGTINFFNNLTPGEYTPSIIDANGCRWSSTITLDAPEELTIELGDNQTIQLGETVELSAQVSFPRDEINSINWLPNDSINCTNCFDLSLSPIRTTQYNVSVQNNNGCLAYDNIMIIVEKQQLVFVPTGFTPNYDGNNDILYIHAGDGVKLVKSFKIFNRWGGTVFQLSDFPPNDPTYGWDGRLNGQDHNASVFTYSLEVEFEDGSINQFKGDIMLIR